MIAKARSGVLNLIGLILGLIAVTFAFTAVAALGWWLWCIVFGGGLVKPVVVVAVAVVLAVGTRFLAELDKYEYIPPPTKTVTTRRASSGNGSAKKSTTTTTTKTTGGTP